MDKKAREEFLKLYNPLHSGLSKFCRAITGNVEDAGDLLHDTILAVMERFDNIRNKQALKAYLFSTASNLRKKQFRYRAASIELSADDMYCLSDKGISADDQYDFNLLYAAILDLKPKARDAIILFHINGFSLKEIQEIQGDSLSAVKLRLKRGREQLFNKLESPQKRQLVLLFFTF